MATKTKKDIVADLLANIYTNTTRDVTAVRVQAVINDFTNSMSVNITIAQLRTEDDSAEHSLANIIDANRQGIFYYDSTDVVTADDSGAGCIVTASNKRYKRLVLKTLNARWYGQAAYWWQTLDIALAHVKTYSRFVGLEMAIAVNGDVNTISDYWFVGGIDDVNLVPKSPESKMLDFTVGDGQMYTPADGATDVTNPVLQGRTIMGFWIGAAKIKTVIYPTELTREDIYASFNPTTPRFSLVNGSFTDTTDYSIMYK